VTEPTADGPRTPVCENGHDLTPGEPNCTTCGARPKMQWMKQGGATGTPSARLATSGRLSKPTAPSIGREFYADSGRPVYWVFWGAALIVASAVIFLITDAVTAQVILNADPSSVSAGGSLPGDGGKVFFDLVALLVAVAGNLMVLVGVIGRGVALGNQMSRTTV